MELYELIISFLPQTRHFNYTEYPPAFSSFEEQAAKCFDLLTEENGEAAAAELIEKLESKRASLRRREAKQRSEQEKQVLALFLAPCAVKYGGTAEAFARRLSGMWNERYPGNRFFPGDYETIMKGFDANLLGLPLRKKK